MCCSRSGPSGESLLNSRSSPLCTPARSVPSCPQPLVLTKLLSVSVDLPGVNISNKWPHPRILFPVWLLTLCTVFTECTTSRNIMLSLLQWLCSISFHPWVNVSASPTVLVVLSFRCEFQGSNVGHQACTTSTFTC